MSGDGLGVVWHLAEEVCAPADEVGAQQIPKIGDDALVADQVVDPAVAKMSGVDGVGIAAFGQNTSQ